MTTDADWRDPVWAKMPSKTGIETVDDHLALAFECNRQLRQTNADQAQTIESLKAALATAQASVDAARAEIVRERFASAEVRKDAERYRWLRSVARTDTGEPWIARSFLSGISAWTGEYADAAIDAAMQPIPCTDKP